MGRGQVVLFRGFECVLHIFASKFYDLLPDDHVKHNILILICTDKLSVPHYSCSFEFWGRAKPTYRFPLNSNIKRGVFRPYTAFFDPKKRDIKKPSMLHAIL